MLHAAGQGVDADRDAKLKELKQLIERKSKTRPPTSSASRTERSSSSPPLPTPPPTCSEALTSWAHRDLGIHIALLSPAAATTTPPSASPISTKSSPTSPRAPKTAPKCRPCRRTGEIDLLIATDCISEGQNLQDCDFLINYDIHWNPVRIIQRFGRIDRIGSVNNAVQLVNFWPTQDLEKYVNLKNRVEARMALVDIAATFEDNILKTDEIAGPDPRGSPLPRQATPAAQGSPRP